jgi:tetratricopeptide (TPR) repeat protein
MRARPVAPLTPRCPWCQAEFARAMLDRCPRCGRRLEFECPECERSVPVELEACAHCGHLLGRFHAEREQYLARLAEAYRAKGWVDQALLVNDYLLELAPQSARFQQQAAQLYDQIGDTTRSVNAYRRLLDLDPENVEALTQLARWYLTLHQTPELTEIGQRLRGLKARSLRLTLLLGDIEYELDQTRSAERIYNQLVRRPDLDAATRARLHLRLGEILLERGQPGRAVHEYEASLATGMDIEETQAARRRLNTLRPPLPLRALSSYGETLRAMAGPVLVIWLLAALQVGFQFMRLTVAGVFGLVLAVLGSYLLACALVTPLTPEWRELLGEAGLAQPLAKSLVTLVGGGLLAAALVLVLFGM